MKEDGKNTKKLDKKLEKKHTALTKNGSSIRNIGIKRVNLLISLHFCSVQNFSLICPKYLRISSETFVRKLLSEFLKYEMFRP